MARETNLLRTGGHRGWATVALLHTGMWLTVPNLAVLITLLEAAMTITIIATALYAPGHISTRAFRLLPWSTPEASTPEHRRTLDRRQGTPNRRPPSEDR